MIAALLAGNIVCLSFALLNWRMRKQSDRGGASPLLLVAAVWAMEPLIYAAAYAASLHDAANTFRGPFLAIRIASLCVICMQARTFRMEYKTRIGGMAALFMLVMWASGGSPGAPPFGAPGWIALIGTLLSTASFAACLDRRPFYDVDNTHLLAVRCGLYATGLLIMLRDIETYSAPTTAFQMALGTLYAAATALIWRYGLTQSPRRHRAIPILRRHRTLLRQGLLLQRHRIAQDLHDGLGSHLMSTLVRYKSGQFDREGVLWALETSMLELRMAVDQLFEANVTLVHALADVRHRLQPVLDRTGISMEWGVDELPSTLNVKPAVIRELRNLLREALSNVIQHSGARRVRVSLRHLDTDRCLSLEITDDGHGFDTESKGANLPTGHGVSGFRARATRIGARFEMQSTVTGGTRVRVDLPI